MNGFENAVYMLPEKMRSAASAFKDCSVEEFRLRVGYRPSALFKTQEHLLNCDAVRLQDLSRIMERISGASLHSSTRSLLEGYINCRGLRVGVCGSAVTEENVFRGFKDFSSLNIRIPHERTGICDSLINEIYIKGFKNTLFISAPGTGKTTALREVIRVLSDSGKRIGIADDRNEITGSQSGIAQFNVGSHSDYIVSAPKAEAAMMLLKAMNEEIIAMDEISSAQDIEALMQIFGCGVGILASAHASDSEELFRRPLYSKLLEMKVFTYLVSIGFSGTSRSYKAERL